MKAKIILLLFFLFSMSGFTQNKTITGLVTSSDDNMPVPGANVIVKGTSRGVSTDFDGNYSIDVNIGETLEYSSLGFKSVSRLIQNQATINVSLNLDIAALDEIIIIGYGEMKSKDLTSAITTIKAEELATVPTGAAMQAMQGKVAGLQIVSNGSPGQGPTVRVRGIGSYLGGASSPLYVVDGMFFNSIDFLNTSDIASISILKDASASAIYGVRAANGVVLIETKSGGYNKKTEISYDGYTGFQIAQNVLKVANAEQFTTLAIESGSAPDAQFILNAMQRYGRSRVNPNIPDVNTDWYKEIIRPAVIQNHSFGITGGAEKVNYSVGLNYFGQEGILDMKNEYERFNLRSKLEFKANEWLTVGINTLFSNATRYDGENSAWRTAYFAVPIMPVFDPNLADDPNVFPKNYANAQDLGYRGGQNPFPLMDLSENRIKIRNTLANFFAEISLVPDKLKFKTAYNHDFQVIETRNVDLPYFIGNNFKRDDASLSKSNSTVSNQIWDNTLTYTDTFGKHDVTVLAGSSYRDESFQSLNATGLGFPLTGEEAYYLDLAQTIVAENVGDGGAREYGISYFGRIAYNYDDRYLLYATFRAEGVRKFIEKWGYFPTIGAGWVISEEAFMKNNGVFDFLKLRGGWGQLGNDKVPSQSGAITSSVVTTALGDTLFSGILTSSDFSALRWELTEETNVGLTAKLLNNDLSLDVDYYIRDTKDAVIPKERPLVPGITLQNIGEIRNSGLEIAVGWNKRVSDNFSYNIGANFASLKNEVLDLSNETGFLDAGTAEFRQRSIVGNTLFAFYGREVVGVYQNNAEIQADPVAVANNLVPGDFKYKENGGDPDTITDDDRVVLGSFLPTYTFGFNVGFNYKNWDFGLTASGQGGNKILNRKRLEVIFTSDTNWDRDFAINRWHGEGTTNSYPSSAAVRKGWNQRLNSYYVEDGDYFRIQNISFGYTINKNGNSKIPKTRIYITAEKPLTIFNYNGFDPEVSSGVDNQTYPIPATYTMGVNIKI